MNRFRCPACGGDQYTSCDVAENCIYCGQKELQKMNTLENQKDEHQPRSMSDIEADLYIAQAEIIKLRAERDAAVGDIYRIGADNPEACDICMHYPCSEKYGKCIGFLWRGEEKRVKESQGIEIFEKKV